MLKQQKGMTLYALVFTIIAMLALAAVAIAMVLDELKYDPEPVQVHTDKQIVYEKTTPTAGTLETETPSTPLDAEVITPNINK